MRKSINVEIYAAIMTYLTDSHIMDRRIYPDKAEDILRDKLSSVSQVKAAAKVKTRVPIEE